MLEDRKAGNYTACCDRCATIIDVVEADIGAARAHLLSVGWFEAARTGKPREHWDWWCPKCAPRPTIAFEKKG